ncbi:MAG TPA: sugar ABC transporter permease, partial [Brachybacterium massiliense]|nr:sugar ABC transporter permease [Brachybacterium massiliense]
MSMLRTEEPRTGPSLTPAPSPASAGGTSTALHRSERRWAALFITPVTLGFALFAVLPFLFSLYTAFTNWNGLSSPTFTGLENFRLMMADGYFWQSLWNTFFLMIGIPIGLSISLVLAMAMNRRMPGRSLFRVIYYLPVVTSLAAISILWQWAFNGDFGLINQGLALIGIDGPNWLMDASTSKPALVLMMVWKGLGFSMLLYLAALQSVPRTLYEAAELDGAGSLSSFRHITLPMLRPVTFFLVVTNIIGGSQVFTEVNIMTPNGGPEFSTATIVWYIWQKGFQNLQLGYATAMSLA